MGWAKYDEDNRDYIEERWTNMGSSPKVFNYTAGYKKNRSVAVPSTVPRTYSLGPSRSQLPPTQMMATVALHTSVKYDIILNR